MRFANHNTSRRGAFLLIALFSCLNIICGFILITQGSKADSPMVISQPEKIQVQPTPSEKIILSANEK